MVAQIDEKQAAMVTDSVHPAAEPHVFAHVGLGEGGAGVSAVGMHGVHFQVAGNRLNSARKSACETRFVKVGARPAERPLVGDSPLEIACLPC